MQSFKLLQLLSSLYTSVHSHVCFAHLYITDCHLSDNYLNLFGELND